MTCSPIKLEETFTTEYTVEGPFFDEKVKIIQYRYRKNFGLYLWLLELVKLDTEKECFFVRQAYNGIIVTHQFRERIS